MDPTRPGGPSRRDFLLLGSEARTRRRLHSQRLLLSDTTTHTIQNQFKINFNFKFKFKFKLNLA